MFGECEMPDVGELQVRRICIWPRRWVKGLVVLICLTPFSRGAWGQTPLRMELSTPLTDTDARLTLDQAIPTVPNSRAFPLPHEVAAAQIPAADGDNGQVGVGHPLYVPPATMLSNTDPAQQQWISIEQIEQHTLTKGVLRDRQTVAVSVADLLARMLVHSKQLQQLQIQPAEARQLINIEYGVFDPTVFVDSQFDVQNVQQKRENNRIRSGIRKDHIYGGRLELSQALGVQDNVIGFADPDQGVANLSISYTQELLREAGRDIVLSRSLIASYQYDQLSAQAWADSNTLIQQTVEAYWQLYQARTNYFLRLALADWAERLFYQIEERSRHLELATNSLEQARALYLDARAELVDAETQILQRQDALFRLVNDPSLDSNLVELLTTEPPAVSVSPLIPQHELAIAIEYRPEIRLRLAAIREAATELRVASNQLLPRLSLSLISTLNGFDDGRDFGGAWGNLAQEPASATASGNFEIFLNNRTAKARNKQAQLRLSRLQLQYEDQLQAIREEVLVALRVVNNALPKIELRALTLSSREREIDAIAFRTWISPLEGVSMVSQLEQLFQAINRLVRTQEQLISAKVELQVAVVELQRAKGSLVNTPLLPADISVPIPRPIEQQRREREQRSSWIPEIENRVLNEANR